MKIKLKNCLTKYNSNLISILSICILLHFSNYIFAQGGASSCAILEANPAPYQTCATNIPFQNSTGGNSETYITSCIPTAFVGPTWFFIELETQGDIILRISQLDSNGNGLDVDFVLWGPFNNLTNICSRLNTSNEKDCSYSPDPIETVNIPFSNVGDIYVLMIDNYSGYAGNISVTQTGGSGTTNCDFLSSVKIVDTSLNEITQLDYCQPTTKDIVANIDINDFTGQPTNLRFNYKWYKNGALINTITNSTSNTNTLTTSETGLYKVVTTAYDITNPPANMADLRVSEDEINLKFHLQLTTITINNTNTVCLSTNPVLQSTIGNQAALNTAIDVVTYQWYHNNSAINGATSTTFTPTLPGNYQLKIRNSPCTEIQSNTIRIIENPLVTITADKIICEGDSFILTSNITNASLLSSVTYQWKKDGINIAGAVNATHTVNATNHTINTTSSYTLEVTEQATCSKLSNAITVRVNALPVITSTPFVYEVCDFITPTLDGIATSNLNATYNSITNTPNLNLYFYQDAALTIPITNPQNYVNTSSPFIQNIYVKAVDQNVTPNCTSANITRFQLKINPTSISTYPNMAAVCPVLNQNYGRVDFNAQRTLLKNNFFPSSPVTITFYLNANDAAVAVNQLTNTSNIPVGINIIYTRVDSDGNCDAIGQFSVEVYRAPLLNVVPQVLVCQNETFLLNSVDTNALAGQNTTVQTSYFNSFTDAENNQNEINKNTSLNLTVGTRTIYIRLFDTATQCFSIINFNLQVFPIPVILNPLPIKICGTNTAVFDLTIRNNFIKGNNTNYLIFYYETAADLAANNFITNPTNYTSISRTLLVKVIDPANNNCSETTSLDLEVLSLPGITLNPTPFEICDENENGIGFEVFNLKLREADMAGNTPLNEIFFKYYENLSDAEANSTNRIYNPTTYTNSTANYQKIYVRLNSTKNIESETGISCYRILELELYVRPYPVDNIFKLPYIICINDKSIAQPAIISTQLNNTDYRFVWYKNFDALAGNEIAGETNFDFETILEGKYSVKISSVSTFTGANLCSIVVNFTTQLSVAPTTLSALPSELIAFELDNTITAVATPPSNDYIYSLNNTGWQTSPVFNGVKEGEYTLTVSNKYNCGEKSVPIVVVDYPKFFTPNGDGYNDTWTIGGSRVLNNLKIYIFDRHGKLLKELKAGNIGWDGKIKEIELPADDYWFRIIYNKNNVEQEYKGHFTLKR